jgi:exopolysaccharide biosynthesis WecB/TagA/CpsF family protein
MKVSIITPTLNSENTILDTLDSVSFQSHHNIEHIIVDGGSKDQTLKLVKNYKSKKIKIFKKKTSIYEAINFGIKNSKGDVIGILASDDIYQNDKVIKTIVDMFKSNLKVEMIIGSLVYFRGENYKKKIRYFQNNAFSKNLFRFGIMPPHPSTFVKKCVYSQVGLYNKNFLIASDFQFFLRVIVKKKIIFKLCNKILVRMRIGGISTKNLFSSLVITKDIRQILKLEKIYSNYFYLILRFFIKLKQIVYIPKNIDNDFALNEKMQKRINDKLTFKIVKSANTLISSNRNFVLSALNLAYLGYYGIKLIKQYKNLYNWPDGIYFKKIYRSLTKIPGRQLLKNMILSTKIKTLHVIGNLNDLNKLYLKTKFRGIKIKHTLIPMIKIEHIKNYLPRLNNNELVFITLPTPKQEIMAEYLANKNKNYKIICIGGSINLASNFETPTPDFLYRLNLEWLWRLRNDTRRRFVRIVESFFYYVKAINKGAYKNLIIKIIN